MSVKFADFFKVNLQDLGKGFISVIITTILTALMDTIKSSRLPTLIEFKSAAIIGLTAGIAYLIRKLFSSVPSAIEIDPSKTVVVDSTTKEVIAPPTAETVKVDSPITGTVKVQ